MDYIYLNDSAVDAIYCSRCGQLVFEDFSRRESHEAWLRRIVEHLFCESPDDN